jgi:hypothetical protein
MTVVAPIRPSLTPTARRGAAVAGSVGFGMLTLGWALFLTPLLILIAASTAAYFLSALSDNPDDTEASNTQALLNGFVGAGFLIPLIASVVVGLVLIVFGVIVSGRVLKSHGATRPWGITWSSIGISIVASWIVDGVLGTIGGVAASAASDPNTGFGTGYWTALAVAGVVILAIDVVIGRFVWWWMASAFRPAASA